MIVKVELSSVKLTRPHEYAIRFLFGGLLTAGAGLIAKNFGPAVAGLFLAFPAIFPASATLIEKHETQRKRQSGFEGTNRGRTAASLEAAGTAIGAISLFFFALIIYHCLPLHNPWISLVAAAFAWIMLSVIMWFIGKKMRPRKAEQPSRS